MSASPSLAGDPGGDVAAEAASALRAAAADDAASLRASAASLSAVSLARVVSRSSDRIRSKSVASFSCSSAAAFAASRPAVSSLVSALRCARSMPVICASASFARRSASCSRFLSVSSNSEEVEPVAAAADSSDAILARSDSFSRA